MSLEGNLLNLGGVSFNAVKVEVNLGARMPEEPDGLHVPLRELTAAPTMLACLSWHVRASTFIGRDAELQSLEAWCEHDAPLSLRFVLGAGGSGKSRLAAELALAVRKRHWTAGFLDIAVDQLAPRPATRDSLLIVDYPEDSTNGLRQFLSGLARIEARRKIRVLCLCRSMPRGWEQMVGASGITEFHDRTAIILGGIPVEAAYELLASASEKISAALNTVPPPVAIKLFEHWYGQDPAHSNPLYIVAAAAHMSFEPEDMFLRFDGRTAVTSLVRRELDRLRRLAAGAGLRETAYIDLAAVSVIQDGLINDRIQELCRSLPEPLSLPTGDPVLEAVGRHDHHGLLHLDMPDIVAACLVAAALRMTKEPAELLWTAMTTRPLSTERFARLAADAQAVLREKTSPLIDAAVEHLAHDDRFATYLAAFGRYKANALDPVLWKLCEAIWRRQARAAGDPVIEGGSLNNLGQALSDQGRHAEAVAVLESAIRANRRVPDKRTRKQELAGIQVNIGRAYIDLGKPLRALKHLHEAIEIQNRVNASGQWDRTAREYWLGEETVWLAWDNIGRARTHIGEHDGALRAFETAKAALNLARSRIVGEPVSWAEHAITINLATAKAHLGDTGAALRMLEEQETALRRDAAVGGSPDRALLLNLVNQLGILNRCMGTEAAKSACVNPRGYLAKANELVDLADKLFAVSGEPVWDLAYGGRVGRAELLRQTGAADEFEDAAAELFVFLANKRGGTEWQDRLINVAAALAASLVSRLDADEARERLRQLIGDGSEAERGWARVRPHGSRAGT